MSFCSTCRKGNRQIPDPPDPNNNFCSIKGLKRSVDSFSKDLIKGNPGVDTHWPECIQVGGIFISSPTTSLYVICLLRPRNQNINTKILQNMMSGIHLILGLGTRMCDPRVCYMLSCRPLLLPFTRCLNGGSYPICASNPEKPLSKDSMLCSLFNPYIHMHTLYIYSL